MVPRPSAITQAVSQYPVAVTPVKKVVQMQAEPSFLPDIPGVHQFVAEVVPSTDSEEYYRESAFEVAVNNILTSQVLRSCVVCQTEISTESTSPACNKSIHEGCGIPISGQGVGYKYEILCLLCEKFINIQEE